MERRYGILEHYQDPVNAEFVKLLKDVSDYTMKKKKKYAKKRRNNTK